MIRPLKLIFILGLVLSPMCRSLSQSVQLASPFQIIHNERVSYNYREKVKKAVHYKLDFQELRATLTRDNNHEAVLQIPIKEEVITFNLNEASLLGKTYEIFTEHGMVRSQKGNHKFFRGTAQNNLNIRIGLTLHKDKVHIMIYSAEGIYQISPVIGSEFYSGIFTHDEFNQIPFVCETVIDEVNISKEHNNINTRSSLECVEVYLEVDHKAYMENGSSISSVEAWVLNLMNQVALFYEDMGIPLVVSGMKIYTSADPYIIHGNTSDVLSAFRDSMNNQGYNGNLAHLLVGRNIGGGRAYLNVLCSPSINLGVSGNLGSGGINYSTYSWNVNVIAHEIGHNFGSPHTHDCAWNGNGTQIDDCGNLYWYNQNEPQNIGSCYDHNNKILPGNQGTIMSYCHATGNGQSINLNNGFHPQVRDRIYNGYIQATCGGPQECSGIPPSNDICIDAINLTVGNGCNPGIYDLDYATEDTNLAYISCGQTDTDKDVWFSAVIPVTGNLTIETSNVQNGLIDLAMEAYTGTCGALSFYSCNDDGGPVGHAQIMLSDSSLVGQTIYIRVAEKSGKSGLFGICVYSSDLPCQDEVDILIEFYSATGGENWTNNTGWIDGVSNTDCNYCNWYGISCDQNSKITDINLSYNNLNGTIPPSLASLDKLENLILSSNNLVGNIPDIFYSMLSLNKIDLSGNGLSGELPISIESNPSLRELWLADNALNGKLPNFVNTRNIRSLYLQDNQFTNCIPFNYYLFCTNPNVDCTGNPALPFSGNLTNFCATWTGTDFDGDGYCYNLDDCNDGNPEVNPGMNELCDGLDNNCNSEIDEGLDNGPNVWVGNTSSSYLMSGNWSMGHMPMGCEDVEIGMSGAAISIDVNVQQPEIPLKMRSLKLGSNAVLTYGPGSYPNFLGGSIINYGSLTFEGGFNMDWLYGYVQYNIHNYGTINISPNSYSQINANGTAAIKNHPDGIINTGGDIYIQVYQGSYGEGGIINSGIIINEGIVTIVGSPNGPDIKLEGNGIWHNKGQNSALNVGGEIEGGGGDR